MRACPNNQCLAWHPFWGRSPEISFDKDRCTTFSKVAKRLEKAQVARYCVVKKEGFAWDKIKTIKFYYLCVCDGLVLPCCLVCAAGGDDKRIDDEEGIVFAWAAAF